MSAVPHLIRRDETIAAAHETMRGHRIRHLPVMDGRRLVGIVSDRDLHLVESLRDVDPQIVRVDEAMTPGPYAVGPRTSLAKVARSMAKAKYGSAIVMDRGRVVGIFTATDALDALAALLGPRRHVRSRAGRAARPHRA
jgi:acetoin utilization protein AcuB